MCMCVEALLTSMGSCLLDAIDELRAPSSSIGAKRLVLFADRLGWVGGWVGGSECGLEK